MLGEKVEEGVVLRWKVVFIEVWKYDSMVGGKFRSLVSGSYWMFLIRVVLRLELFSGRECMDRWM